MKVESITMPPVPLSSMDASKAPSSVAKAFVRVLDEIEKGERLMEKAVRGGLGGKDFSTRELIALQAGVYEYSHRLEVFSKLVDKAASAVRQVMNP